MSSTPQRLNDRVTWPPIQPMYRQRVLCFVFNLSHGRIRVCKIKFVSTGESRGKPCPAYKKKISLSMAVAIRDFSVSTCLSHPRIKLLSQIVHHCYMSRLITKQQNGMCAQSDQRLRCPHEESFGLNLEATHWTHSEDSDQTWLGAQSFFFSLKLQYKNLNRIRNSEMNMLFSK